MPSLFYAGQPDYIEKLNTLATAASMTNGTVAASFLSLAVTGTATAASFVGPLTGNASTATTLATARNINGVSFNGSADITVTAAAGTLTGATLAAGVTASSLTSVGTLTALTVSGTSTLGVTRVATADSVTPQFGVSGTTKGVRFTFTSGASAIEGVDNTLVGSYQPLLLNASQHQFKINAGTTLMQLDAGAVAVTGTFSVTGQASFAAGSAAAPSVKVGAGNEGLYSLGSGTLGLSANGRLALRLETVASSVNYLYGYANATGGAPVLRSVGSDTNVDLALGTQGSGAFAFLSHGATTLQFRIASVASATNYWQAQGNVTSGAPTLFATGSDTNVNALYSTKGTGEHFFYSGGAANLQFKVGYVANAVNRVTAYGNATGLTPGLFAEGSDANVGLGLYSKAAGPVFTAVRGAVSAYFDNPASAVNYATITGSATGLSVVYGAAGTDAAVPVAVTSKGTASVGIYAASGTIPVLFANHTAAAVNYLQINPGATGNAPTFSVGGSDTNIGLSVNTKGTGAMKVLLNSVEAARFSSASTLGSYWDFKYVSAINELKLLTGGAAANLGFSSSGGGAIRFYTNDTLENQVVINRTASAVNQLALTGSATGGAVTASAEGSDANIDFAITPKGTGVLRFGTHSALAAETVTGYITIKDSAGNTRKLAVLS